jgi:hypothetical protein
VAISFVSVLVLVGGAVLFFLLIRRFARRVDLTHGSVCGRCGYSVRGLTTFTCPECGGDLREVGIYSPIMRQKVGGTPSTITAKVTVWSVMIVIIGLVVTIPIHKYCLPTVYSGFQTYGLVEPRSGLYKQVDFHSHGYHLNWPYRQPKRSLILEVIDITLTASDGKRIEMQVTIDQLGYTYTNAEGQRVQEADSLDGEVVLDWMRSAGIDTSDPELLPEAAEIVRVAKDATHLSMNARRQSAFSGRTGGRSATYAAKPKIAAPISVFFWLIVWLIGVQRIFVVHQRAQRQA